MLFFEWWLAVASPCSLVSASATARNAKLCAADRWPAGWTILTAIPLHQLEYDDPSQFSDAAATAAAGELHSNAASSSVLERVYTVPPYRSIRMVPLCGWRLVTAATLSDWSARQQWARRHPTSAASRHVEARLWPLIAHCSCSVLRTYSSFHLHRKTWQLCVHASYQQARAISSLN